VDHPDVHLLRSFSLKQCILAELAEGSLVLVSSLDPEHEDRVLNEIYMLDKKTGELCETPLNIPEHIVQCIMNVMKLED